MDEALEPAVKAHLEEVVRLIECAVDQMHTYVRFVGD
jgi:hypothetical protein